jgi:hypothetical protein
VRQGWALCPRVHQYLASRPAGTAPVILAQRLRRGSAGSPRGAARLVGDAPATLKRVRGTRTTSPVLLRADSAFYGYATVAAAAKTGTDVSITARMDTAIRRAIAGIDGTVWQPSGRQRGRAELHAPHPIRPPQQNEGPAQSASRWIKA